MGTGFERGRGVSRRASPVGGEPTARPHATLRRWIARGPRSDWRIQVVGAREGRRQSAGAPDVGEVRHAPASLPLERRSGGPCAPESRPAIPPSSKWSSRSGSPKRSSVESKSWDDPTGTSTALCRRERGPLARSPGAWPGSSIRTRRLYEHGHRDDRPDFRAESPWRPSRRPERDGTRGEARWDVCASGLRKGGRRPGDELERLVAHVRKLARPAAALPPDPGPCVSLMCRERLAARVADS